MTFLIVLTPEAESHLLEWKKSGQKKTLKKIVKLFEELRLHPATGTGKPEQLRGNLSGFWSRRIDKESRMIYRIDDNKVIVTVISIRSHYGEK